MIYAPRIPAGNTNATLLFQGQYQITDVGKGGIFIDGNPAAAGASVTIDSGIHHFEANHSFRLKLQTQPLPPPRHQRYLNAQIFFPNVYVY